MDEKFLVQPHLFMSTKVGGKSIAVLVIFCNDLRFIFIGNYRDTDSIISGIMGTDYWMYLNNNFEKFIFMLRLFCVGSSYYH